MSKKVSKLSRKCANKNTHRLNINNLDKSSDDFEDDARPFTRNSVKINNKNRNTSSKNFECKDGVLSIYSVCDKFSANQSGTKMCNNENVPNEITKEKTITEENCTNGKIVSVSAITQGAHPITLNNIVAHLEPHEDSNYGTAKILDTDTTKEVQNKLTRVSEEPQLIAEGNFKLPPCRLCGKDFKNNHESKRIAHLKECGALLGVGAGDLVKLRRLEEKQAAEWKDLALPQKPPTTITHETNHVKKGRTVRVTATEKIPTNSKKRRKPAEKLIVQSSNDPNLEMALALSASLAQNKECTVSSKIESNRNDENIHINNNENEVLNENKKLDSQTNDVFKESEIIMPNASCWWKKPISPVIRKQQVPKRACNRKTGKTKLESLTDVERNRQISEKVSKMLSEPIRIQEPPLTGSSVINLNGKDFQFDSSPQRIRLRQWWKHEKQAIVIEDNNGSRSTLWEDSKLINSKSPFFVDAFKLFQPTCTQALHKDAATKETCQSTETYNGSKSKVKYVEDEHVHKICEDFEKLFDSGSRSDLTIFTKNERPMKCHSLVIFTRCKKILEDIVQQKSVRGNEESVICWNSYEYTVVYNFLKYLYSGKLPKDIKNQNIWEQHKQLSKTYGVLEYLNYMEIYDKSRFENHDVQVNVNSLNAVQTTGGFLEEGIDLEDGPINVDCDELLLEVGVTQKLDILLNEFNANLSTNALDDNGVNESVKITESACKKDEAEDDWQDVHAYFTQKPPSQLKKEDFLDVLPSESFKTPEKPHIDNKENNASEGWSTQESRADSPDMFADEDDISSETNRFSTPAPKNSDKKCISEISSLFSPQPQNCSILFNDNFDEDMPSETSPIKFNGTEVVNLGIRSSLVESNLPSPTSSNKKMNERSTCDASKELIAEPSNEKEQQTKVAFSEDEIDEFGTHKLSTPLNFSDNEDFNEIIVNVSYQGPSYSERNIVRETSINIENQKDLEKKVVPERAVPMPFLTLPIDKTENNRITRIFEIRSQLKSTSVINEKTIEILLQELLSMHDITINILLTTGIGKTVKNISTKYPHGTIKRKSDLLVSRWTLQIDQHAESQETDNCTESDAVCTPSKLSSSSKIEITPRPHYELMATPAVHNELKKYGIRDMAKQKAIPLLDHIYKETHPLMKMQREHEEKIEDLNESFESSSTISYDDVPEQELMEESILLTNNQFDHIPESSQQTQDENVNLRELVLKFIQNDIVLYRKCLTYEPIWLEEFFTDFKTYAIASNVNAKQIKLKIITDILDNECITFRTGASANRNKIVNAKSRKASKMQTIAKVKRGKKRLSSTQCQKTTARKPSRKRLCATQS